MLKRVIGPWILQQHDIHVEVAKTAAIGLTAVFPGAKLAEALSFCSTQVTSSGYLAVPRSCQSCVSVKCTVREEYQALEGRRTA